MSDERNPLPAERPAAYAAGAAMVLIGGVALSSGGIIIRFVDAADGWQILFYRAVGMIALLLMVIAVRHRGRIVPAFRNVGANGVVLALGLGAGFVCYVWSMLLTTVANVSFIISAGPLFAAAVGWLVLRERVAASTWMVIGGAVVGMGLMFADGLSGGRLAGNLVALGLPSTFAIMVVMIRRAGEEVDMLPATCLAGAVAGTVGLFVADTLVVPWRDMALCLFLGFGQLGLGFMLITFGARHVPAAETALLALSESVLAPIWAWLFLGEVPAALALAGGLLVLGCVVIQGVFGVRRERARRQKLLKVPDSPSGGGT